MLVIKYHLCKIMIIKYNLKINCVPKYNLGTIASQSGGEIGDDYRS